MMGMKMPETCWAVFKWQVINLRICYICLVDSIESMMMHGLANPKLRCFFMHLLLEPRVIQDLTLSGADINFTWRPIYIFDRVSQLFLEWGMFQTKIVEKIKTYILYSVTFFFSSRIAPLTIFIHLVVCLTTGPKPLPKRALHIVRSRASSFKW